jgi:small subunit ribosomal protein S24e
MVLDVLHPNSGTVQKSTIRELLAKMYSADEKTIFVFGFKTDIGGLKSTGFANIYDSLEDALDCEPKFRLVRQELAAAAGATNRKLRKESKNKRKTLRGTEKDKGKKKRKGGDDDE